MKFYRLSGIKKPKLHLGTINKAANSALSTNLTSSDLKSPSLVDADHNLNLAFGLHVLHGKLGNGVSDIPHDLSDILFLLRIIVRVILIIGLTLGRLRLGLRLRDLNLTSSLADVDQNIASFLGSGILSRSAGGESGFGVKKRLEDRGGLVICTSGDKLDADGILKVRSGRHHGVCGLIDVLLLKLFNKGRLDCGTTGGQVGRVDRSGRGGGRQDSSGLGEDGLNNAGDLGSVGCSTAKDNLLHVSV